MKALFTTAIVALLAFSFSMPVMASSTGGYGGNTRAPKKVDQVYEYGKAVFQGKVAGKYSFCVDTGTEKVKVKKGSKSFKRKAAGVFAAALYDCNEPDAQIANKLSQRDLSALVYYFNKRFRLRLTGI